MRKLAIVLALALLAACNAPNKQATVRVITIGGGEDTLTVQFVSKLKVLDYDLIDENGSIMAAGVMRFSIIGAVKDLR